MAANSGWNDVALLPVFRRGLTVERQLELACRDAGLDLERVITLTVSLDPHLRGKGHRTSAAPQFGVQSRPVSELGGVSSFLPEPPNPNDPEPMQLDSSCLTPEERRRRVAQRLCI